MCSPKQLISWVWLSLQISSFCVIRRLPATPGDLRKGHCWMASGSVHALVEIAWSLAYGVWCYASFSIAVEKLTW